MAKNILDFSKFTFTAEQIRDINDLVFDELLHAPDINYLHTLQTGIVYDREIGFITGGGLVGKKGQGCDPVPQEFTIGTRKVVWQPKTWEVFIAECAKDLEATAAVYVMNNGVRMDDLTDTDYMAIVVEVLSKAVHDFIFRIVWLGDTEAENVGSSGGIITAGVDTEYFDIIDGFFKQLEAAVADDSNRLVTIAANSQGTKAAQMNNLTPENAYNLLSTMYYKAPVVMRASGNMRFLVTQSLADKYQQYLTDKGLESTYRNMVDGVNALSILGVEVIAVPKWDEMIQAFNDLGATFYKPHRALLIEKANLAVGVPATTVLEEVDVWYDKTSRKNYLEAKDKIDAKLLNPARLVYAQ